MMERKVAEKKYVEYSDIEPKEYHDLVKAVGLWDADQSGISSFFGVDGRMARYWRDGERKLPIPVVMVLELMKHFCLTRDDVGEITQEGYEDDASWKDVLGPVRPVRRGPQEKD